VPNVTLVGLPSGTTHATVTDPETGTVFEPNVTVEVDAATAERLKAVEQFGFSFLVGDASALETVKSPADVSPFPTTDAAAPDA